MEFAVAAPQLVRPASRSLLQPTTPGTADYGAAPMEDAYWCVTCRRAWPIAVWEKQQWRCPSGLQTRQQPHPHIGLSLVNAIRGVEPHAEFQIDESDN